MADCCQICMVHPTNCDLVCKHSFCFPCVKEWYNKSESEDPSCPMCRQAILFKGMAKQRKKWDEEKKITQREAVFQEALDYILSEYFEESDDESEDEEEEEEEFFRESAPEPESPEPEYSFYYNDEDDDDRYSWFTGTSIYEPDIIEIISDMQNNFNKLRDKDISLDFLFSVLTNPAFQVHETKGISILDDMFFVNNKPIQRPPPRGLSQKCRRRQSRTLGGTASLIQLLADQLFLVF